MKISDFLGRGAKNARTCRELREVLHMRDPELRDAVRRERLDGVPICSRTHADENGARAGFYLPDTEHDYIMTIRQLRSREKEIAEVRRALEKAYHNIYGA